jgi:hypothetical protein
MPGNLYDTLFLSSQSHPGFIILSPGAPLYLVFLLVLSILLVRLVQRGMASPFTDIHIKQPELHAYLRTLFPLSLPCYVTSSTSSSIYIISFFTLHHHRHRQSALPSWHCRYRRLEATGKRPSEFVSALFSRQAG